MTPSASATISLCRKAELTPPIIFDSENRAIAGVGDELEVYDGRNRVIGRGDDGHGIQDPHYVENIYDGWNVIEDYDTWTGLQAFYIHGPQVDEMLCKIESNGIREYYHQDALGSTVALTNSSGNVVERYTYDIYGAPTIYNASGTVISATAYANRFLFTGREWLSSLNAPVYDYRNRVYSPTLGRFLQMDPILFDGGDINLYKYCTNDPVEMLDPNGTSIGDIFKSICRCLGGAANKGNDEILKMLEKFYNSPYYNAGTYAVPYSEAAAALQIFGGCNSLGLAIAYEQKKLTQCAENSSDIYDPFGGDEAKKIQNVINKLQALQARLCQ